MDGNFTTTITPFSVPAEGLGIEVDNTSVPSHHLKEWSDPFSADGLSYVAELAEHYYTPVLCLLGSIGNGLSLAVFCFNANQRSLSSSYYLSALAISDTGFLLTVFVFWLETLRPGVLSSQLGCPVVMYVGQVTCFLSVWFTCAFTVERFFAVCSPLKRSSICTVSKAKKIILSLTTFALLAFSYALVIAQVEDTAVTIYRPNYATTTSSSPIESNVDGGETNSNENGTTKIEAQTHNLPPTFPTFSFNQPDPANGANLMPPKFSTNERENNNEVVASGTKASPTYNSPHPAEPSYSCHNLDDDVKKKNKRKWKSKEKSQEYSLSTIEIGSKLYEGVELSGDNEPTRLLSPEEDETSDKNVTMFNHNVILSFCNGTNANDSEGEQGHKSPPLLRCTVPFKYMRISIIANYLDTAITLIIPFCLITYFNVRIAVCVWRLKDERRRIVAVPNKYSYNSNSLSKGQTQESSCGGGMRRQADGSHQEIGTLNKSPSKLISTNKVGGEEEPGCSRNSIALQYLRRSSDSQQINVIEERRKHLLANNEISPCSRCKSLLLQPPKLYESESSRVDSTSADETVVITMESCTCDRTMKESRDPYNNSIQDSGESKLVVQLPSALSSSSSTVDLPTKLSPPQLNQGENKLGQTSSTRATSPRNWIPISFMPTRWSKARVNKYQQHKQTAPTGSGSSTTSSSSETRVTKMLLLVSTVFLLLNLPSHAIRLAMFLQPVIWGDDNIEVMRRLYAAQQLSNILLFNSNYACNFFLYCLSGRNFRKSLWNVLFGRCHKNSGSRNRSRTLKSNVNTSHHHQNRKMVQFFEPNSVENGNRNRVEGKLQEQASMPTSKHTAKRPTTTTGMEGPESLQRKSNAFTTTIAAAVNEVDVNLGLDVNEEITETEQSNTV